MSKVIFAVACIGLMSACSMDPANWETAPVTVQSPQGEVVCQLYSKEITTWDRAISRPDTMSVAQGDAICRAEGVREKNM